MAASVDSAKDDFVALLERYRLRAGRSRNGLAKDVGVDPSYLQRIAHGERTAPSPHIIEAIARSLRLTIPERNRLLVSAGYAPPGMRHWDDALQSVLDVLDDLYLPAGELEEFRMVVQAICARWRSVSGPALLAPVFHSEGVPALTNGRALV